MKKTNQNTTITSNFINAAGNVKWTIIEKTESGKKLRISGNNGAGVGGDNYTRAEQWSGAKWEVIYEIRNAEFAKENGLPQTDSYMPDRRNYTEQTFRPYIDHVREVAMAVIE